MKARSFTKLFTLVFLALFLVTSVFAAVTITPNPAYDSNDLTCLKDGLNRGYEFYWYVGGTAPVSSQNPLPASFTSVGDTVTCRVYAPTPFGSQFVGEASTTVLADVVANRAPTVTITSPADGSVVDLNTNVDFTADASDPDGDSLTYAWDLGDGRTSNTESLTTSFSAPGTYVVTLTVSDGQLSASDSVTVTVRDNTNPYDGYSITELTVYSDAFKTTATSVYRLNPVYAKFSLRDQDGNKVPGMKVASNIVSYNLDNLNLKPYTGWLKNSFSLNSYILNGEPLLYKTGDYYFVLNNVPVLDSWLGLAIVDANLVVEPSIAASVKLNILNNPVVFNQLPDVELTANQQTNAFDLDDYVSDRETPDNELSFSAQGPSDISVSVDPITHIVSLVSSVAGASGVVTFTVSDNDGSTVFRTINVNVLPETSGVQAVITGGDRTAEVGELVDFDGSQSTGNIDNYVWTFSDGATQTGVGHPTAISQHAFANVGDYSVTLTVFDANGVSSTDSVVVHVVEADGGFEFDPRLHASAVSFNFDFAKITAVPYDKAYRAGDEVRVIVKLANQAGPRQDLHVSVYVPGSNVVQELGTVHVDSNQNVFLDTHVKVPASLNAGVYAAKFVAFNDYGVQKTGYWKFVVTR